jgi:arylsulfatase A
MFSSYGGTSYQTPNIDDLASESMRCEHFYAAPVCHPARITLMTGWYPFRFGDPVWGSFPEHAEGQTFAHELKKAGYATAVAGKWQLCMMKNEPDHPHRLGFDEYCLLGWHEGPRYHHPLIWQNGEIRQV